MRPKSFLFLTTAIWILSACQFTSTQQEGSRADSTAVEGEFSDERSLGHAERGVNDHGNAANPSGNVDNSRGNSRNGVNRESVLMEKTTSMEFDRQEGAEIFRVSLFGDSILTGTVAFTITNGKGELIYSDEFPASMLAATYDETVNTPARQEALVKRRIDEFFTTGRFKEPAIDGNQPPHDSYFIEEATYDNLRETNAPGFLYLIGKENTKHIAWSPLEQKVVMYFNCC